MKDEEIKQGGDPTRQRKLNRLTVRERLERLLDDISRFLELGLWAGYELYPEWRELPAAGVVTGIGQVAGRECMVIANDATVKAGAFFPQTVKKVIRAQRIGFENRLPILYLVDSSGVFLPLQDEIFPDEDDFGRIFRNNAVLSAQGVPQYAAIMGNCIAGGGYLPVLCDQLVMTEGSGLYLAGPALVKATIGQVVETEELGGARMHSAISGTVDFREPDDRATLKRLRSLVALLPSDPSPAPKITHGAFDVTQGEYEMRDLLKMWIDADSFQEYKAEYGRTLITGFASIQGHQVGPVANQRTRVTTPRGEIELGGVLYSESADKTARFALECNQLHIPLIFVQDVVGFMVGKEAEQSGIIRSGAKLVNAISNSIVPKITLITGRSFGAGHYALCGRAYDPRFILAWPTARYAGMEAEQAAATLAAVGKKEDAEKLKAQYTRQADIHYAAARGWVDAIIEPTETREWLSRLLTLVARRPLIAPTFHTGVIQT